MKNNWKFEKCMVGPRKQHTHTHTPNDDDDDRTPTESHAPMITANWATSIHDDFIYSRSIVISMRNSWAGIQRVVARSGVRAVARACTKYAELHRKRRRAQSGERERKPGAEPGRGAAAGASETDEEKWNSGLPQVPRNRQRNARTRLMHDLCAWKLNGTLECRSGFSDPKLKLNFMLRICFAEWKVLCQMFEWIFHAMPVFFLSSPSVCAALAVSPASPAPSGALSSSTLWTRITVSRVNAACECRECWARSL